MIAGNLRSQAEPCALLKGRNFCSRSAAVSTCFFSHHRLLLPAENCLQASVPLPDRNLQQQNGSVVVERLQRLHSGALLPQQGGNTPKVAV